MNSSFVMPSVRSSRSLLAIALGAMLAACGGGGGGGGEDPPPRFESTTVGSAQAVRDNQTGIVWAAGLGAEGLPSSASEPTAAELWQLAEMGAAALRPSFAFVLDAPSPLIKVAEQVNATPGRVWAVDFGVGYEPGGLSDQATPLADDASPDVSTWYVLSRTATTPPAVVYPLPGTNGTVAAGGLMWKICTEGTIWNRDKASCDGSPTVVRANGAQALANAVNAAGFAELKDWRVPSKEELRSLLQLESQAGNGTLLPSPFVGDRLGVVPVYWSTGRSADGTRAWLVDFTGGEDPGGIELAPVDEFAHVRLVRTPR